MVVELATNVCQTLPREVIDMIIDFLHDDRRTLKSCAAVCKQWVSVAHPHLFRDYRIEAT
ncbi:hypothetical protein BC835DRAFT_1273755, partial [Cytidiella melzeri]